MKRASGRRPKSKITCKRQGWLGLSCVGILNYAGPEIRGGLIPSPALSQTTVLSKMGWDRG